MPSLTGVPAVHSVLVHTVIEIAQDSRFAPYCFDEQLMDASVTST
ncbi:hypothetical protein [Stenomitos frigidus]|nr:hypothetical protein [Stenomitos frigidus]